MTKEKILRSAYKPGFTSTEEAAILEAMSEYASQCTAPLAARIRELEDGLREFPGFNIVEYNPENMVKWTVRVSQLLSSSSQTP